MNHPILYKSRNILTYFIAWLPTVAVHYFFLINKTGDAGCAFHQSVIYTVLFAILGISVWWVIYYNRLENSAHWSFFVSHLAAASIIISIWTIISQLIINLVCYNTVRLVETDSLPEHIAAGLIYYTLLILFFYLILTIDEKQKKAMGEERMSRLAKESELKALKSQVNPHFLFNSLNSANYLTAVDPKSAGEMLVKLSDYLRFSLKKGANEMVTLKEELENCKRYLELEHYRFGEKLKQEWNLENSCLECMVPVMLLQPLFENAVKHGVYESTEPIIIQTTSAIKGGLLLIEVGNFFDPDAIPRKGEGVGLSMTSDRLRLVYGSSASLRVDKSNNYYKALVTIPLKTK